MRAFWALGVVLMGCATPATVTPATPVAAVSVSPQPSAGPQPGPAGFLSTGGSSSAVPDKNSTASAPLVEPGPPVSTAGHSRENYLAVTSRVRARRRKPPRRPTEDTPAIPLENQALGAPPLPGNKPRRLLYSGNPSKAPKDLLNRPGVLCEISFQGGQPNVRYFGP